MQSAHPSPEPVIVVGFADAASSAPALRWAIRRARMSGARLRVVHASSFPLTAHNSPSASVAQQLGNPSWAALHSTVAAFSPPVDVHTVADQGAPARVISRWTEDASLVVLGRRQGGSRWRSTVRKLRGQLDVPVIEIGDRDLDLTADEVAAAEVHAGSASTTDGRVSS